MMPSSLVIGICWLPTIGQDTTLKNEAGELDKPHALFPLHRCSPTCSAYLLCVECETFYRVFDFVDGLTIRTVFFDAPRT